MRGPNLMLGYYRYAESRRDRSRRSRRVGEGWYDTGDVVEIDHDGMVTISGRVKRFAKIAGEMVSLDMIEHVAREASARVPSRRGARRAGFRRRDHGAVHHRSRPHARRACWTPRKQLGTHDLSVARRIVQLKEIPLLASGKMDYIELKGQIEGDAVKRLLAAAMMAAGDRVASPLHGIQNLTAKAQRTQRKTVQERNRIESLSSEASERCQVIGDRCILFFLDLYRFSLRPLRLCGEELDYRSR